MKFYSATLVGVQPIPVEIEIDLSGGLPFFQIVGLPDAVLRESKTRVKSAIIQSGFEFPYDQRVVLNLAPSEVKKEGSSFELAMAARILATSGQIQCPESNTLFLGELGLDGSIRAVPEIGALTFASHAVGALVIPKASLRQIFQDLHSPCPVPVVAIETLQDLKTPRWWEVFKIEFKRSAPKIREDKQEFQDLSFSEFWARHLEIAAVGRHHYFICGPPGCGKTFFAESLRDLLDCLNRPRPIEVEILDSLFDRAGRVPWASPHHSATAVGLIGGGSPPRPGAVTRAHGGVLFLDELLEFSPSVLDSLREPLEKGCIEIHRAGAAMSFPSRFQLIAATNPCRCGYWKHPFKACRCQRRQREMYQARISGPFFDRFDIRLVCQPPRGNENQVKGSAILKRVRLALELSLQQRPRWSKIDLAREVFLTNHRTKKRIQGVAETLALLDLSSEITRQHLVEANKLQFLEGLEPGP